MPNRAAAGLMTALSALVLLGPGGCTSGEEAFDELRERMVQSQIASRGVRDTLVLRAMRNVPRHEFVPLDIRYHAYIDNPLPIGLGQTISQPYIVALMTSSLDLSGGERILEVGTGSGYQAAVLAEIAGEVYTIEIIPELAARARATLDSLGYGNVHTRAGDGYDGWPEHAPFDGVIVTAAAPRIPPPLVDQLKEGGRFVIPVGNVLQELQVFEKREGRLHLLSTLPVRFVPMKGKVLRPQGE